MRTLGAAIWRTWAAALLALLFAGPSDASAAWLGFKNTTQQQLVIQTSSVVNGQVRPNKSQRLYPGEVVWEAVSVAGQRRIDVYYANQLNKPALQDLATLDAQTNVFFAVALVPGAVVPVNPAARPVAGTTPAVQQLPPVLKLIKAVAPVKPPAVAPATPAAPPPKPPPSFTPPPALGPSAAPKQ